MASRTLAAADRFPAGASVSAYLMSNWLQSQLPAAGAPQGASVVTAVVAASGSVVLGGLAEDTRYLAYALVSGEHRYVSFSTLRPRSTGVASGVTFSPAGTVAATDVQAAIEEVAAEAGGADASATVKGVSKLSVAPAVPTNPVAVGDNDARATADQAAGQASVRTLGSGAQQAAGGTHTHTVPDAGAAAKGVTLLSVAPAAPTSPIAVGDNDPRVAVQKAVLAADLTLTSSSIVLQDVTGLAVAIGASVTEAWVAEWAIIFNGANATMDLKFGFTAPAGAVVRWGYSGGVVGETPPVWAGRTTANAPTALNAVGGTIATGTGVGVSGGLILRAHILGGGTPGNVQLQAAQSVSDAGALKIEKLSTMRAERFAT